MGLSSNQARFLSLTARQVDMEQRIQQICQRRLRLSSELENVATQYNNQISNRKMFTASQTNQGINTLSLGNIKKLGYSVIDTKTKKLVDNVGLMNKVSSPAGGSISINSEQDFLNLIAIINAGGANATTALSRNYALNCDIDLSDNGTFNKAVINGDFNGIFDGQGHTISGVTIAASSTDQNVGFFSHSYGTIKNLILDNANVTASGTSTIQNNIGTLAGNASGTIDNVAVINSSITVGDGYTYVGGIAGGFYGTLKNSYTQGINITAGNSVNTLGGLTGDLWDNTILNCYSSGSINVGNNATSIAGLCASPNNGSDIANCYSSVDITTGTGAKYVGGLVDTVGTGATVTNSYAVGNITAPGGTNVGGFVGVSSGTVDNTNFYKSNLGDGAGSSAINENISSARPQNNWNPSDWDLSGDLPTLRGTNDTSANLEEGLRNGVYSLVKDADEFTQDPLNLKGNEYQEVDWRSTPEIYDELYKGDDAEAENKYDKTVSEINAQDKKLQLEQTSVEVEYKAVTSEKEAVKKILDTNAQSSFKYFS